MKSLKNTTLYSRLTLITSVTLVVGYFVVYAWTTLSLTDVESNDTITSTLMQGIVNNINDLNTRVSNFSFSSGNVGIGTASPSTKLNIYNTTQSDATQTLSSMSPIFRINGGPNTNNNLDFGVNQSSGYGYIQQWNSLSNTTYPLLLQPGGGNVGIGTTSPGAQLDVQGTVNIKDTLRQGNITTYVTTISAGASSTTYPILRQFHDSANWGNGGALIEEFTHYYSYATFDYGMFFASYGYSGNSAGILTKVSGAIAPVWGAATLISGTYYYRDLFITLPAYYQMRIRITTPMSITTNLTGAQASKIYLY